MSAAKAGTAESPCLTTRDFDDVIYVLNALLKQIDERFTPLEGASEQNKHGLAYVSNQLDTITRRLEAIENTQASLLRRLQEQAAYTQSQRPYRERVRRFATHTND